MLESCMLFSMVRTTKPSDSKGFGVVPVMGNGLGIAAEDARGSMNKAKVVGSCEPIPATPTCLVLRFGVEGCVLLGL